ncbi:MAG: hypothetical protein JXB15_07565 [Anaerolineales bacterium]|nr:hypothetical protein [Anaerolineales bacterium]
MLRKPIFVFCMTLALVSMACSLTINLPVDQVTAGPTQEQEILVKEPDAASADVSLSFGAGELAIAPGAQAALISGKAIYNVEDFKPNLSEDGNKIKLTTGNLELGGIPNFDNEIKNEWDLKLGDMPMHLTISAGAYQGSYELGGLSLQSLDISDGASDVSLAFSEPNLIEMDSLRYSTGASNVKLKGLSNANFKSMIFRGGAGDYTLDFSGKLRMDAVATVEAGISHVVIIVPKDMNVKLIFKGGLANIDVSKDWDHTGNQYVMQGQGPLLTINVDMGAGNLELKTQ